MINTEITQTVLVCNWFISLKKNVLKIIRTSCACYAKIFKLDTNKSHYIKYKIFKYISVNQTNCPNYIQMQSYFVQIAYYVNTNKYKNST